MKGVVSFCLYSLLMAAAQAQQGYRPGDVVADFRMQKMLNHPAPATSFSKIKESITIIDFFGTWCAPCIRALPHLSALQQKYSDRLQIVLVSVEEEEKLKKFIRSRNDFIFPLVVDEGSVITALFQPPSYPYTVVLNRDGKVLAAVSDVAALNEAAISNWLSGKMENASNTPSNEIRKAGATAPGQIRSANRVVQLSQDFLYAAKTGDPTRSFEEQLKNLDRATLEQSLTTDDEKKAFWINLYNAFSNSLLKKNPEQYKDRNRFFKAKQIRIGSEWFSLDDIEHDLLRRSKIKWSLGYLNKPFPSEREKRLRVAKVDYRIHFALNCGAKSCPPIAYYSPERLDQQLEVATQNYLTGEVEYKKENNTAYLPAIMSWFRGDFGGKKGIKELLRKHNLIPEESNPKMEFKPYDWTLQLNNYKTETE